jgi:DNA helicase-2/ATP-dependent DNA helicase PcrA
MKPTPEQAAVINHPLEPLRVVAGAGAGKTSTMAWRLAHLVDPERADPIKPEEALGITFTNKAAEQLSDKLRSELPGFTTAGRSVEVTTYHGFARSLLIEFGALVGVERNAVLLTAGYQRELMRRALGTGHYDSLDLSAAARRVEDMSALWSHLGDNLVGPETLLRGGGDPVTEARSELAAALTRYQTIKADLELVDYSDLIAKAYRLTAENADVVARVRGRYRVVLLDEFQDTNAAQRLLLLSIFGDGFPVTAVGDANQTIYEWRGASTENFRSFPRHFARRDGSEAITLSLTVNHRSDRLILDAANAIRRQIDGNAGVVDLAARPDAAAGFVGCARLHDRTAEAEFIAEEVEQLHGEGVAWRDIACLFRRNADMGAVRQALESNSIPVEVASLGGLLDVPVVQDLHAWLRVLGSPDDAVALMRILNRGRYRLGLGDLAPLAKWVGAQSEGDDAEGAPGWVLLEAVDELDAITGIGPEAARRLGHFRTLFRDLLRQAQGVSLVELCLRVLDRTGTWQEVEALDDAARLSARLNLYRFLDLAEEWSPLEGRPSLRSFLEYLELLAEDTSTDQLDTARLSGENAVALMTVHRAKGLEWAAVFLPVVVDGVLPAKGGLNDDPISQARSLPYEMRIDGALLPDLPEKDGPRQEMLRPIRMRQEWRVAYVAATRARHRLYLTGAHWYDGVRPKEPSELFLLVSQMPGVELLANQERGVRPQGAGATDGPPPDPVFASGWEGALRHSLADPAWPRQEAERRGVGAAYAAAMDQMDMDLGETDVADTAAEEPFRTSVTGLVTYATCPKRFFWSEIDRLPRRPSSAARRGVEVHRQIELHNRGTMALEWESDEPYDIAPGEGDLAGAYSTFLSSRFAEDRPTFVEVPFDLRLEAGRIRGRIDAIYATERDWEIVDFKSGRNPGDGASRVQLEAYAVAATDVAFAAQPPDSLRVTFAYLGGGLDEVTEVVDAGWLERARAELDDLTAAAAAGAYPTTPSVACHNCDFLRFCESGRAFIDA